MQKNIHQAACLTLILTAAASLTSLSCTEPANSIDSAKDGGTGGKTTPGDGGSDVLPSRPNKPWDIDLLFMIDNSSSMKEEQERLRKNFVTMIDALRHSPGGMPNLHIGIISSDVGAGSVNLVGNPACSRPGGDRGRLLVKPGCGIDVSKGNFIVTSNNETQNNYTGRLEDVLSCMADLGVTGCGFEHQLQSIRLALSERRTPENKGFVRADAVLGIVMLTDEDDCSADASSGLFADNENFEGQLGSLRCNIVGHRCNGVVPPGSEFMTTLQKCEAAPGGPGGLIPVQEIVDSVFALKPPSERHRIVVSAVTGLPKSSNDGPYAFVKEIGASGMPTLQVQPICSSADGGGAAPVLRIREFVLAFGANASWS